MVVSREIKLQDGRTLQVHDSGDGGEVGSGSGGTLLWHHGSPQTGALLAPVLAAASERGIRLLSYGRPSYGGSTGHLGRTVADAASDVEQMLDALGITKVAMMGASGGGPHVLACAAALPDRVTAAVTLASIAPFPVAGIAGIPTSENADDADVVDWFAGMADPSGLRAALSGREERARQEETAEFDSTSFVDRDYAALEGTWSVLGEDVAAAEQWGMGGLIDDDCAFVRPWDVELASISVPVLLIQGGRDRVVPQRHAERLLRAIPTAELWLRPRDGHVSVLDAVPVAMDWIRAAGAEPGGI
jgi:pimeloyl-ACP methyl ester carboxylesterase